MTNEERDIQHKLRVFQHAEKICNARKACLVPGFQFVESCDQTGA